MKQGTEEREKIMWGKEAVSHTVQFAKGSTEVTYTMIETIRWSFAKVCVAIILQGKETVGGLLGSPEQRL